MHRTRSRPVAVLITALVVVVTLATPEVDAAQVCSSDLLSCTAAAAVDRVDACCTPAPAGLFVFRQRFEPDVGSDMGSWGIDGIDVLECFSQQPATRAVSPPHIHEEIGSFCHRSSLFGGERGFLQAEGEWAQSEVGEGMEEVWERAWMNSGRFISTLSPQCNKAADTGANVASFFHALHKLHRQFQTAKYLAEADITPSSDTTYSLEELTKALSFDQHKPVTCLNSTLSSVLWPLNVRGTFQDGTFEPSQIYSFSSNCPAEGVVYQPSTTLPRPTAAYTWDPLIRPSPRPITLTHDESKLYYQQQRREEPKQKLGFFKGHDEEREEGKEEKAARRYVRDEL